MLPFPTDNNPPMGEMVPPRLAERSASAQLFTVSPWGVSSFRENRNMSSDDAIDLDDIGNSMHSVASKISRAESTKEKVNEYVMTALQSPLVQFIIAVIVLSNVAIILFLYHKHDVYLFMQFFKEKWYAPYAFAGVFTIYVFICFPCTFMEFLAGYIFPNWIAFLVCTFGKNAGSLLSYTFGRYLGSDWIRDHMLSRYGIWKGLQLAQEKRPWQVTFLIRLGYIPLMLKNYGLSVMHCPFHIFVTCSFFAGLPFTFAINHAGYLSKVIVEAAESGGRKLRSPWDVVMLVVGLGAVIGFLLLTRFYTKRALAMVEKTELGAYYGSEQDLSGMVETEPSQKHHLQKGSSINRSQDKSHLKTLSSV